MKMRVNCEKKSVDLNKTRWAIDRFKMDYQEDPSYIIISYETKVDIMDQYYFIMKENLTEKEKQDYLFGIPVAYNEALKYGEVDVI